MFTGVKLPCYPTLEQASSLRQWMGHQKFIYNAKVQEQDYWYKFSKSQLALTGKKPSSDQMYSQFHNDELTPWLSNVPSQILRNGVYRFTCANTRFHKGLGGAPKIKKKHGRKSVLITSELFEYTERAHPRPVNDGPSPFDLTIGTKKFPIGKLKVKAHVSSAKPNSITISEEPNGHWFLSFCCELPSMEFKSADGKEKAPETIIRTHEELMYEYALRSDLQEVTVGMDRGIAIPLAASSGSQFDISDVNRERIEKKDLYTRRFQRRMAKQVKGSASYRKNRLKVANLKAYSANVRKDFAHKASHALVSSEVQVFVFEDLKLKNMTAAPKAKVDDKGRYIKNGAAAKAGLNKALLSSALGLVKQYVAYKAAAVKKLVLSVPAHFSSQECSVCEHVDENSRLSQSIFKCTQCGHTDNADFNASKVIRNRGVKMLKKHLESVNDGTFKAKVRKTVRVRKVKSNIQKVGQILPEPVIQKESSKPVARCGTQILETDMGESVLDVVYDHVVCSAVLVETGNPHLGFGPGGG
ncbi:MAG: transposase [Rhodoferax sp.]|nr:transposase [Rhodoferax sp.]